MPATKTPKAPAPVLAFRNPNPPAPPIAPPTVHLQLRSDSHLPDYVTGRDGQAQAPRQSPDARRDARRRREYDTFMNMLQTILLIDPDAIHQFAALAEANIEEMQEDGRLPWEETR